MAKRKVKKLDLEEFRDSGLLQEVNRQFFHPLGLALEVYVNKHNQVTSISGIQDNRGDPAGMVFGEGLIDQEKIDNVQAMREKRRALREKLFVDTDMQDADWVIPEWAKSG